MRFIRQAAWLNGARAGAYTRIFAVLMAAALAFNAVTVAFGLHPGGGAPPDGRPDATDFLAFWSAGRLALTQGPGAAYDLAALGRLQHATAFSEPGTLLAFFYPPTFLLLCLPFAALPYLAGLAAFVATTAGLLLRGVRRLLPAEWGRWPVLGFPGLLMNAATGQNGFLAAAAFAWGAVWLDRAPWAAGMALGVLAAKPHLAVALPLALAASGRWRAFAGCAVGALTLAVLSWLFLGSAAWSGFFASAPAIRDALENHAEDWGKLMSAYTLARHLGAGLAVAYALQALVAALAAAVVVAASIGAKDGAGVVALAAAAGVLITPHVLDYDLAVLAVPLAWMASRATGGWRDWERAACGMAWLLPFWARLATAAGVAVAPVVLLGLLAVTARRLRETT